MIEVNKNTSKYNVNPRYMISDTFEDGYKRFANEQVAAPPDKVALIATALSFILLIAILILTSFTYKNQFYVWLALAALCVILLLRSVMKYTKARKEYLKAAGKPTTISKKRKRFYSLFSDGENLSDLPNVMSAGEFLPIVARLMGKQEEQLYNGVLRTIHEKLAAINNPNLPMAKIITPFGDVFNQTKRRLYVVEEDNKLIFFDADWMNPKGEIVCDMENLVSFGRFSQYPSNINSAGGGKIKPDSVIIEIKDDTNHIYFEMVSDLYNYVKKMLPSKLEKK
ncbi:MAG: hypothetical protein IIW02_05665 [Clostridia bacterium]|nr:hypothetical protein [Clostridia bacterium]